MNNNDKEFKNQEDIASIFNKENLPAIVEVLNYLRPRELSRVKPTEFETVVSAAKGDYHNDLLQAVMEFSLNHK